MTVARVIIKGRCERREFCEPFRQCTEMLEKIGVECHVNSTHMSGGHTLPDELTPPDFVLLFQSYPHEFPKSDLVRLRRANPFAPFFFILGVCCEGMLRTAGPLDSPFYRYAHGWSGKEIEQIRLFLTDQPSLFALPLTVENDEIAQWETTSTRAGGLCPLTAQPLVLILTHFGPFGNDSAMNRLIFDENERLGCAPIFSGKTLPKTFKGKIVADADDSPPEKILETIQRLRRQFADNDFTVYVDSPRFH